MDIISVITEPFSYPFFMRALTIGSLISLASAILGIYIVLRRESIIGHTIADVSFLGIALGLALSLNLDVVTILIAVAAAIIISLLQSTRRFSSDSILAFTAEISLALAIFIVSRLKGYRIDLLQYLFGDILGISSSDVTTTAILVPTVLAILFFARKKILQVTFSEELSISSGTNVFMFNALFTVLVAITIAAGIKVIGIILITAFLIIPANIAKTVARNFRETVFYATASAIFSTFLGLVLSYIFDAPSGAMIVLVLGGLLFTVGAIKGIFELSLSGGAK